MLYFSEGIFEQSSPYSPIIFILSPGSDPASDLMKLAERSGFGGNRLKFLAMGQGQEKVAAYIVCLWLISSAKLRYFKTWARATP